MVDYRKWDHIDYDEDEDEEAANSMKDAMEQDTSVEPMTVPSWLKDTVPTPLKHIHQPDAPQLDASGCAYTACYCEENIYRLVQEPRRLWKRYLVTNTLFFGMMLSEAYQRVLPAPRTPALGRQD